MKKNFKFMLIALLALFSFSSANAAEELVGSTQYTNDGYQYKILTLDAATKTGTVSVSSSNWVSKAADPTVIVINPTITINLKGKTGSPEVDFNDEATFDIVKIEENGFKGLSDVTSITFAEGSKINAIGAGAFEGTMISDLNLTNTKVTKLEKLFEDANTTLKTVTLPASLTEVAEAALEHTYALNSIDADLCVALITLGANCFGDNVVVTLDLSNTIVEDLSTTPFVGASGESGEKNRTLTELVLPATVNKLGTGLANLYNLTSVNLEATAITDIDADGAFENDKSLTELTFPATIKEIAKKDVFKGCAALATLNIPYDALTTVGDGTNPLFVEASTGDGTLAALKTLNIFSDNAATKDFAATIAADAFSNLTALTSVSIAAGDDITSSAVLTASAITLSNEENSTIALGNLAVAPGKDFIAGPTATGVTTTLIIGDIDVALTDEIVSGNISTATVGAISEDLNVDALGEAQKLVFTGDIDAALSATTGNTSLEEINFGSIAIKDAADNIAAKTFSASTLLTKVTWTPEEAPTNAVFAQTAFGESEVDAAAKVVFTTTEDVAALYPKNVSTPSIKDEDLYNVVFSFDATSDEPEAIHVYGPESGSAFIGYFLAEGGNYEIAKTQNGATITVYSAFVDESDYKLYMDPLQIVDGKFVVEKGQVVVIRSTTSDDVEAFATTADNTMRYNKSADLVNDLLYTDKAISADELGTKYYDAGQYVYYLTNPATTGAINFRLLGTSYFLPEKSVYTVRNGQAAAGRLDVVWLDSTEEATAILNTIERNAALGSVIYNLAGQKVDANYKGIVIKNGKKMIQK